MKTKINLSLFIALLPFALASADKSELKIDKSKWDIIETFSKIDKWEKVSGAKPKIQKTTNNSFVILRNALICKQLPNPTKDLSMRIKLQQTKYQRGQWVAVFNKAKTKGVGIIWDSSLEKAFKGQGFVCIIAFDLDKPVAFASKKTKLNKPVASGVKVGSTTFLKVEMEINPEFITVMVNGKKEKVKNPMNEPFEYLYVRGNDLGYFDEILVKTK